LSATAGEALADARTGKNGRHALVGMLRQSVFGRLAGYEDVNDAVTLSLSKGRVTLSLSKGGVANGSEIVFDRALKQGGGPHYRSSSRGCAP
jgi:hypothetical protein